MSQSSLASSFIGRMLAQRYRLDAVLGTGGMGAVYQAHDTKNQSELAVKVLHQLGPGTEEFHQRFFNEAIIAGQLFHPNIVQVIGFDKDKDGTPFLIMELLRGRDLYDLLREREKLPLNKALEITRQVGSALHAAHNLGVAHRDIKPSNIFLSRQTNSDGEAAEVVKVVDFGLSKELGNSQVRRTAPGIILGTVEYVSPEGTTGESEQVDFYSDQWALSVVMYRMLSGRLPFEGGNLPKLLAAIRSEQPTPLRVHVPEVPDYVATAIERAMSKDKAGRFESVQDFVRALSGLPTLSQSLSSVAEGGRPLRAGRLQPSQPGTSGTMPVPPSASQSVQTASVAPSASGIAKAAPVKIVEAAEPKPRFGLYALIAVAVLVFMIGVGISARRIVDSHARQRTPAPATR